MPKTTAATTPAAKTPASKQTDKAKTGPTWKLGLFRNAKGKLCTVYVTAEGKPVPYEARRVAGAEILRTGTYSGMKYSEARQRLLAEAKKEGLKDEPVPTPAATEEKPTEAPEAAPAKKTRGSRASRAGKAAEVAEKTA